MGRRRGRSHRSLLGPVVAAALAALAVTGCGAEGERTPAVAGEGAATTEPTGSDAVTTPPPETAPEGGGGAPAGGSESDETEEAASAPEACPDVVITPNSGAGLFDVEVQQITCPDATTALQSWGEAGFPGDGPEGFVCEQLSESPDGSTRLSCTQGTSGGVVKFTTGS